MEKIHPSFEHQRVASQSATVLSELLISDGFILRGIKKWIGVVVVALLRGKWMVYGG